MIKELMELFNKPKEFVDQCQQHLIALDYTDGYDYDRYIKEEVGELIRNNIMRNHIKNRSLLVDDIVDSMWVLLATVKFKIDLPIYLYEYEGAFDVEERTYLSISDLNQYLTRYLSTRDMVFLDKIFTIVSHIAHVNSIDWTLAFSALVEENISKLNFPPEMRAEVFRDGKCNKKDPQGNLYPWYKPADFSRF